MADRGINAPKEVAWLVWLAYAFPCAMFAIAIVPGLNRLYSGHGGPAWFLALLAFPVMSAALLVEVLTTPTVDRPKRWRAVGRSFLLFLVLAFPASVAGAASIRASYGLTVEPWALWVLLATPLGVVLFL